MLAQDTRSQPNRMSKNFKNQAQQGLIKCYTVYLFIYFLLAMSFRTAQSFSNRFLAHCFSRLEQQKQGLERIREVLPPMLAKHALHCVIDEKKLLLYTDSAAWASQLRFYKSEILAAINSKSATILQIRILAEKTGLSANDDRKANIPSSENIAMLQNYSGNVSDIELKLALQKLSATLARL